MINKFEGQYRFLSNFYSIPIIYEGLSYNSVENAFQAAKTLDTEKRKEFQYVKASEAKKMGKLVELRPNWEQLRVAVMYDLVKQKFTEYKWLGDMLLDTGTEELQEGNWWGDKFWGTVNGIGENHLGKILMQIRSQLNG